jgi:hypothetical protein
LRSFCHLSSITLSFRRHFRINGNCRILHPITFSFRRHFRINGNCIILRPFAVFLPSLSITLSIRHYYRPVSPLPSSSITLSFRHYYRPVSPLPSLSITLSIRHYYRPVSPLKGFKKMKGLKKESWSQSFQTLLNPLRICGLDQGIRPQDFEDSANVSIRRSFRLSVRRTSQHSKHTCPCSFRTLGLSIFIPARFENEPTILSTLDIAW